MIIIIYNHILLFTFYTKEITHTHKIFVHTKKAFLQPHSIIIYKYISCEQALNARIKIDVMKVIINGIDSGMNTG